MIRKIALSALVAASAASGVALMPQTATAAPAPQAASIAPASVAAATGVVTTNGADLQVRAGASTTYKTIGEKKNGTTVQIICQFKGQEIDGMWGKTVLWDKLVGGGWVSDGYVKTGSSGAVAPMCGPHGEDPAGTTTPGKASYPLHNNYPYAGSKIDVVDKWNFFTRECTSFAAFAVNDRLGIPFNNSYKGQHWGDAKHWVTAAKAAGLRVDTTPNPGDVAVRTSGTYGHVAFVAQVNADGSYVIEEYNGKAAPNDHKYSTRTLRKGDGHFNVFISFK